MEGSNCAFYPIFIGTYLGSGTDFGVRGDLHGELGSSSESNHYLVPYGIQTAASATSFVNAYTYPAAS